MLEIWQLESFQKQRKNRLMLFTLLLVVFSSDSGLQFERKLLLPCRWRPLLSFTQDTPPFLVAIIWKEATSTTALINTLGRICTPPFSVTACSLMFWWSKAVCFSCGTRWHQEVAIWATISYLQLLKQYNRWSFSASTDLGTPLSIKNSHSMGKRTLYFFFTFGDPCCK